MQKKKSMHAEPMPVLARAIAARCAKILLAMMRARSARGGAMRHSAYEARAPWRKDDMRAPTDGGTPCVLRARARARCLFFAVADAGAAQKMARRARVRAHMARARAARARDASAFCALCAQDMRARRRAQRAPYTRSAKCENAARIARRLRDAARARARVHAQV